MRFLIVRTDIRTAADVDRATAIAAGERLRDEKTSGFADPGATAGGRG